MKTSKKRMLAIVLSATLLFSALATTVTAEPDLAISDAVKTLRYITGTLDLTPAQKAAYDMDADGDITIKDAVKMLRIIAGIDPAPVVLGTRKNPLPLGATVTFDGMDTYMYKYIIELTATEVIRGDDASELFSNEPEEGKEFFLVKFKIKAIESEDDKKITLNNALFGVVSKDGIEYGNLVVATGIKKLDDIYAGGETEGYIYQIIDAGDEPTVVFLEGVKQGIWFSTAE